MLAVAPATTPVDTSQPRCAPLMLVGRESRALVDVVAAQQDDVLGAPYIATRESEAGMGTYDTERTQG
jgi:hypothetical protein